LGEIPLYLIKGSANIEKTPSLAHVSKAVRRLPVAFI
jgi:hypothetical protein